VGVPRLVRGGEDAKSGGVGLGAIAEAETSESWKVEHVSRVC
jgi:hypothetical protein